MKKIFFFGILLSATISQAIIHPTCTLTANKLSKSAIKTLAKQGYHPVVTENPLPSDLRLFQDVSCQEINQGIKFHRCQASVAIYENTNSGLERVASGYVAREFVLVSDPFSVYPKAQTLLETLATLPTCDVEFLTEPSSP